MKIPNITNIISEIDCYEYLLGIIPLLNFKDMSECKHLKCKINTSFVIHAGFYESFLKLVNMFLRKL